MSRIFDYGGDFEDRIIWRRSFHPEHMPMFIYLFTYTMNPITSVLMSTNWWFVLACVVMSLILWMIWFNKRVFGDQYIRWMKFPKSTPKPDGKTMAWQFGGEIISRVLFFMALNQAFQVAGWDSLGNGIILAIVIYILFVFSTQLSHVSWSFVDRRVLWLLAAKGLIEVCLAAVLWYVVF